MSTLYNTVNLSIDYILPIVVFSISLIASYISYPVIIRVSNLKNLMAEPNHRDVHSTKTSNLGGVGLFFAISRKACSR